MFRSLSQPMEEFWIRLLALLVLVHQTASASDATELIGAVGGSVKFRIPETRGHAAFWSFGNDPIVTVTFEDRPQPVFFKEEYKTHFAVSESGRALSITRLRMEDAGTYSVTINGKIFAFTLQVYRELTEPTVTCEAQECLGSICLVSLSCSVPGTGFGDISYTWTGWGQWWEERPAVLTVVDKSTWDNLELLRCTARNAISSRSVTVTTPGELCPGNPVHPPGPGALSIGGVKIEVIAGVTVVVILLVFLFFFCKSKGHWLACPARVESGSAKISATAGPGHWDCLQAMSCLGPAPGTSLGPVQTRSETDLVSISSDH